jgi:hypothetical protein
MPIAGSETRTPGGETRTSFSSHVA